MFISKGKCLSLGLSKPVYSKYLQKLPTCGRFYTTGFVGIEKQVSKGPKKFVFEDLMMSSSTLTSGTGHADSLPYSYAGFKKFNREPKDFDNFIVNDAKLDTAKLKIFFKNNFVKYLQALESFKKEDFPQIEPNFFASIIQKAASVKDQISVVEDTAGFSAAGLEQSVEFLEQTMIKGVKVIRGDNPPLELIYSDFKYESQGL